MADFRSFKTARREPASPMKPVVDPAGWSADELKDVSAWSYQITDADGDELEAAVAAVRRKGVAMVDIEKRDFPLEGFADVLTDVRRELLDGRIARAYLYSPAYTIQGGTSTILRNIIATRGLGLPPG